VHQILEDDGLADPQTDDEEGEREMWLTIIKMNVVKCVDLMASLRKVFSEPFPPAKIPIIFCPMASSLHCFSSIYASLHVLLEAFSTTCVCFAFMFGKWYLARAKEHVLNALCRVLHVFMVWESLKSFTLERSKSL
jgi:hypothetical protein